MLKQAPPVPVNAAGPYGQPAVSKVSSAPVDAQSINKLPGVQAFLRRLEAKRLTLNDLGLTSQKVREMASKDPNGLAAALSKLLDIREEHALGQLGSKPEKVDAPHRVAPAEKTWSRIEALGPTPGKDSAVGGQVIARMRQQGKITGTPPNEKVYHEPTKKWYPLSECDMGHTVDAVTWWNKKGQIHGAKSDIVRAWMKKPEIYELEPRGVNRSRGAQIGENYNAPHPDPITTGELSGAVKKRDAQGNPVQGQAKPSSKPSLGANGRVPPRVTKPDPRSPTVSAKPATGKPPGPNTGTSAAGAPVAHGLSMAVDAIRNGLDAIADQEAREAAEVWLRKNRPAIFSELFKHPGQGMVVKFNFERNGNSLRFLGATQYLMGSRPDRNQQDGSTKIQSGTIGAEVWFAPVRKAAAPEAPGGKTPNIHTAKLIIDSFEKLLKALPSPLNNMESYYLLKSAPLEMGVGYRVAVAGGTFGVDQTIHGKALAFYERKVWDGLEADVLALVDTIKMGEKDLQDALNENSNAVTKWWNKNRIALLDPHAFDRPKSLAEAAKAARGAKSYREARNCVLEARGLVDLAKNSIHHFRTGFDRDERDSQ